MCFRATVPATPTRVQGAHAHDAGSQGLSASLALARREIHLGTGKFERPTVDRTAKHSSSWELRRKGTPSAPQHGLHPSCVASVASTITAIPPDHPVMVPEESTRAFWNGWPGIAEQPRRLEFHNHSLWIRRSLLSQKRRRARWPLNTTFSLAV